MYCIDQVGGEEVAMRLAVLCQLGVHVRGCQLGIHVLVAMRSKFTALVCFTTLLTLYVLVR